ncbi:hypothetical protein N0V90_006261 [Kalmusia sp. IMI 367209]|nr:hypothetical protein N0V90_006261 [Kalmusia sp. IMI 367209]
MASEKAEVERPGASSNSDSDLEIVAQGSVSESRLLRKLDLRLLPAVSVLYLLSFLDRSNVANARIEGLTADLKMTGNQYLTGLTLYFVGYVLFEIPCNIILKRTTPKFWLPTLTIAWGIVATLMGVTQNLAGFFVEGLATIVIAALAYLFISNYPESVSWLSKDERSFIQARLKADSDATNDEKFTWAAVLNASKDPKPTIIKDMGYTAAQSQLLTIPPYAAATIFTIGWAILAEKFKRRALFTIITTSLAIIGYIILLSNKNPTHKPGVSYVGTFFAAMGIYPSVALVLSWPAVNVSGQTKRATANAMQISIGNLGAVIGTQLYRPKTSPRYVLGHSVALGYLVGNLIVVGTLWWLLTRENKKKQEHLVAHPHTNGFHDTEEDLRLGDNHPRWHFNT